MHRSFTPLAIAVTLSVLVLAGCGGSSVTTAIAHDAKRQYRARTADCSKAGLMVFVGKRTTVYDCELRGVDPAHRPLGQGAFNNLSRCFVRAEGNTYEVTDQVLALEKFTATHFRCH